MKQIQKWLQALGDALVQLENVLKGQRPALQPVPIRVRPVNPPVSRQ